MSTRVTFFGNGEYGIVGPYNETVRRVCRGLEGRPKPETAGTPGMRWEPTARAWIGYIDAVEAAVIRASARGVAIDDSVLTERARNDNNAALPIKARDLRPYQAEGANFILTHGAEGCILADDMGLGKSVQFLRAARALRGRGTAVIVCPGFVRGVWPAEAKKWWPEAEVIRLHGTKPEKQVDTLRRLVSDIAPRPDKRHGRVIVVNYDILYAWIDILTGTEVARESLSKLLGLPAAECFLPPIALLGFDEGQFLASEKSRRSKAAKQLAPYAGYRVALSGTPVENTVKDLWNLVDTISPGRFGNFFSYALRYCNAHREQVTPEKAVWLFDGESNTEELAARIKHFVLRRTTEQVKLDLPPRIRTILPVEVARGQRMPLREAVRNDTALRRALDLAADGKFKHVHELVEARLAEGKKVVVFCHRRAVAEVLAQPFGKRAGVAHGQVPQARREKLIAEKPDALFVTMDSTKGGIDLSAYDVAVFAELHWVPSTLAQCEKRLHRHGQVRTVYVYYVIAEGTADELIRDGCIRKLEAQKDLGLVADEKLLEQLDGDMRDSGAAALAKLAESLVA